MNEDTCLRGGILMKQYWVVSRYPLEYDPEPVALAPTKELAELIAATIDDGCVWDEPLPLIENEASIPKQTEGWYVHLSASGEVERVDKDMESPLARHAPFTYGWAGSVNGVGTGNYPTREAAEAAARALLEQGEPEA